MGRRVSRKKNILPYIIIWVVFVLVLIGGSVWFVRRRENEHTPPPVTATEKPEVPEPAPQPEPQPEPAPQPPPDAAPVPEVPTISSSTYEWGKPVGESAAVEDKYFADCAFVGNSLIEGFQLYSGLKTGDYYTYKGITVSDIGEKKHTTLKNGQKGTVLQGLSEKQHKKVYIMMGLNELGYRSYEIFSKRYSDLVSGIKKSQPDANIIILSVLPVTKARSDKDAVFNLKNVGIFQELVRKVAEDNQVYYVNLAEIFTDKDGYLPAGSSKDGVHLTREYYEKWLVYLKTHTIDMYLEK